MTDQVVFGIKEMSEVLEEFTPRIAANLSKAVIHSLAAETAKQAKKNAPKTSGNLKKSIKAKRRRGKPGQPISDVIITQGKGVKNDGFYWRFVEFGTKNTTPAPFLTPAKLEIQAKMPQILEANFKKKLIAAVNREKKKAAKK